MASRTTINRLAPRLTRQVARHHVHSRSCNPTSQLIRQQLHAPSRQSPSTHQTRPFSSSPILPKQTQPPTSSTPPEADPPSDIRPYDFASISSLVANPDASRMIIDVREPGELQQSGRVPGAQNMPINSAPDGLFLPAEEFEDRFGFEKPTAETEVVFYCKAGVRSRAAARVAKMAGWQKVGEYPGSWVDWEKNGGKIEK